VFSIIPEKYDFSIDSDIKEKLLNRMLEEHKQLHQPKSERESVSFADLLGTHYDVSSPGKVEKAKEKNKGGRRL
jgi:hypothetical protein